MHLGGNCNDFYDSAGVLIHRYGPHYFRTNSPRISSYLSQFTTWNPINYRISSFTEGRFWSFPINLTTFEQHIGRSSTEKEFAEWLSQKRVAIANPENSEDVIISQVGWELYRRFFEGYTIKHWRRHPRELDASVCGRIPVRTSRDDRYFNDSFQALPSEGYTEMFKRMILASDLIDVKLGVDFRQIKSLISYRYLIFTGPIDEFYDHCYGPLPYRSLRFEPESFTPEDLATRIQISGKRGFWQPQMQVNYPNEEAFTRIVEIKHATGQDCPNTTIVREYPEDFGPGKEPYYPIPAPDTQAIYRRYAERAASEKNVSFVGRLATYRYYNMDQVVGMALTEFDRLAQQPWPPRQ
jgi:UDP-galactopyranose mutase